jgi:thioredoxin reductase (NADPH)
MLQWIWPVPGLAFHGVPGGHEFTSFVLGMYNASGPGQAMDEDI